MQLAHEFIDYDKDMLPINWIFHHSSDTYATVLPHWHKSIELSYTYNGTIDDYTINGVSYCTKKGEVLVMNPADIHSVTSHYNTASEALTIQISLQFIKQLIPDLDFKRFVTNPTGDSEKKEQATKLQQSLATFYHQAQEPKNNYTHIQLMSIIYRIIYQLASDWMYDVDYSLSTVVNDKQLGTVEQMMNYIDQHAANTLTIDSIATVFHVSPYYVSKLFKNKLNIGVMTYVQLVRARNAQELLLETDKPIHVISDLAGFPNEKSFRKVFVHLFECTPKQYQMLYRAKPKK